MLDSYGLGGTNRVTNEGAFLKEGTGTARSRTSSTRVLFDNTGTVAVQALCALGLRSCS